MKYLLLSLGLFALPSPGFAAPETLLDCNFEHTPIQSAMVYSYQGKLFVLTMPAEGEWIRRELPSSEWDSRIIHLADTPELKAVVFRRDHEWLFSFKGPNGWYMSGSADCNEL